MRKSLLIAFAIALVLVCGCEESTPIIITEEPALYSSEGVFIVNEGGFGYGDSSLSYFDISTGEVENGIFSRANGQALGDVAQSMAIYNGRGYIVVNNSGVVFVVDISTCEVVGTIEGLTSPRYVCFCGGKGYISDMYGGCITVFDPKNSSIIGTIATPSHLSTEEMVVVGDRLFVSCWVNDNKLLVIDTNSDSVVDSVEVGYQPQGLAVDREKRVWVLSSGDYATQKPSLYAIRSSDLSIESCFELGSIDFIGDLQIDGSGDTLFFVNRGVWKMDVNSAALPATPFINYGEGVSIYALGVDPKSSEIYLADAIDYRQSGVVYRYGANATPIDTFRVGVAPGFFLIRE